MMRFIIIFITLLLCRDAYAQANQDTPYYMVIQNVVEHHSFVRRTLFKSELDTILIETFDSGIELPDSIGRVKVRLIDKSVLRDLTKHGKRVFLVYLGPPKISATSIEINAIDFSVTRVKNKFIYLNGGGGKFYFKYDCDKHAFIVSHKIQGGI